MNKFYPDYYKAFHCKAERCLHNCCIGWEIDIDPDTLDKYRELSGKLGEKLKNNISEDEPPHFVLGENERCPFLNKQNLCELIIESGDSMLCNICAEHPRFHNSLPDRTESGVGLSCEAAAELIIGKKEKTVLICDGNPCTDDNIIILRDRIISVLQDRSLPLPRRLDNMLSLCESEKSPAPITDWIEFFLSLERLDEKWTEILLLAKEFFYNNDGSFDCYIEPRQTEYEQFCVYLIYRHFANSFDLEEASAVARFVMLAYELIFLAGGAIYHKTGSFDFKAQTELMRIFSSEIEYSDINLKEILDRIYCNTI